MDSSEIRYDENSGPFFPIQFPSPIKYEETNGVRYQVIQREREDPLDLLGNIDIGQSESEESLPLIAVDRDIEIYQKPKVQPYSGESIELEMFDLPDDVFYSDFSPEGLNHPGNVITFNT